MSKTVIGITGGIGSGKTTVCNIINQMGYPVFYSDLSGRVLLEEDEELKAEIKAYFGDAVFKDGSIVRARLGEIVFNNKEKLDYLNSLIHPRVKNAFLTWKNKQESKLVFKESAILFESKDTSCNYVCSVVAQVEERIERVKNRDGVSRDEVLSRINNQMTDEERIALSDFIIKNNSRDLILPQIVKIIASLEN